MTNAYGNLELHMVLLSAMKDINKICKENGLSYYLHAGTLLGAMNHKGFIPWDDDVDISFMREDYDIFLQLVQDKYSDKYFIHNFTTDNNYRNNRSVLRIIGTRLIGIKEDFSDNINDLTKGIGIDIVPLDAVPDYKIQRFFQKHLIWLFDAAVRIKQGEIIPSSIFTKALVPLSKKSRIYLGQKIDEMCKKYNRFNTKYVGLLSYTEKNPYTGRSGYENDIMLREWFEHPVLVSFEDTEFMTISEPVKDLVHRYGEHWHDPYPEEKRVTKHNLKGYYISDEIRKRVGL